jgi:Transposase
MYEQATRLLGLEGLVVMALEERGAKSSSLTPLQLGAAGELAARAPARMPRGLSLDEAHHRRGHELATVVSDPDRRCVLNVIDGRPTVALERYMRSISVAHREAIEFV